nr:MAG TPA: hypothetical protein [Caudoviricetes sp.]
MCPSTVPFRLLIFVVCWLTVEVKLSAFCVRVETLFSTVPTLAIVFVTLL